MNTAKKKAKAWAKVDAEAIKVQKRIAYAKDRIDWRWIGREGAPNLRVRNRLALQEIIYWQTLRYERLKTKAKAFG